jgi:nicotinamidase-related amidase
MNAVGAARSNYDAQMDSGRTALLIMDVQPQIVERFGDSGLTERLARAAGAARGAGVRVVYVKVGFREGYPEISRGTRRSRGSPSLAGSSRVLRARCTRPSPRRRAT